MITAWKIISFFFTPLGKYALGALIIFTLLGSTYIKGRTDGRAAYKAKIEREIADAVRKGDAAREKALRDFNALPDDRLPDDGFRRD